ncbi:lactoylglutathione lyase [Aurantivibrio plasticivorans]
MATFVSATGIGVSDLSASEKFYADMLGMDSMQTIKASNMDEIVMGYKGTRSAAIVLMHFTDGSTPNYKNNPIKLVFMVEDCAGTLDKIAAAGYTVVEEPKNYAAMGDMIIGFAKDPDGYLIELMQKPEKN